MSKLSHVIKEIEQDADERQKLSDTGSPVSSMTEDIAEGKTAEVLREWIRKLKQVDSL